MPPGQAGMHVAIDAETGELSTPAPEQQKAMEHELQGMLSRSDVGLYEEVLPDGTYVTTTYGHWTPDESPWIVSVRFTLDELDRIATERWSDELFVATPLTGIGEFTPGIEGPACDADGNVYAAEGPNSLSWAGGGAFTKYAVEGM